MPPGSQPFVGITIDEAQYADLQAQLSHIKDGAPRAVTRAINRTLTTGVAQIARELGGVLNVKIGTLKEAISIAKATFSNLLGIISISRRPIPLIDVKGARATKKGVVAQVRKDKPKLVLKHSFKAKMKSGHQGFYQRVKGRDKGGRLTKRGIARRLPIEEHFAGSALGLFGVDATTALAKRVLSALYDIFMKNLASQIDGLLGRRRAAA